jgi:hypothetical protein
MANRIRPKVLAIGLFAGTLDIADALIFNVLRGITPRLVVFDTFSLASMEARCGEVLSPV